jgi:hypothetical protein
MESGDDREGLELGHIPSMPARPDPKTSREQMKMAYVVAGLVALLIASVFVLVFMNRASSEVVGAALPVVATAVLALVLVFTFGKPSPIERSFPVTFIFQQSDLYPILVPHRPRQFSTLGMFDQTRCGLTRRCWPTPDFVIVHQPCPGRSRPGH